MNYLNIKNVWKEYGDQVVLEQLNTTVEKGEFITIVGTSGCGKTTFLKMLLGTEVPSRGAFILNNEPLIAEPNDQRGIVFQRYSVFPHLTVLENVLLSSEFEKSPVLAKLFGKKKAAAKKEALEMIEAVGLSHALSKYPHELSGGMQQRLALAQSLIKKPSILLLDEPFGALDPGIRKDMHQLVLKLWQQYQLTIFMITHDIEEGFFLGTRLWVFDKDRHDPQAPNAYGAQITYDLPVGKVDKETFVEIESALEVSIESSQKTNKT